MVLDGYKTITIARSAAHQQTDRVNPYMVCIWVTTAPAHATSAGKILLAHLSQEEQLDWLQKYPLQRLTKYTHVENDKFLRDYSKEIREQDWCYSREEHVVQVFPLAITRFMDKTLK